MSTRRPQAVPLRERHAPRRLRFHRLWTESDGAEWGRLYVDGREPEETAGSLALAGLLFLLLIAVLIGVLLFWLPRYLGAR